MGDISMYTDFKMLKVKVLIIFFGTQGFSARRDRRYTKPTMAKSCCTRCMESDYARECKRH
jgi:hypothetical protein